jgi:hypothetical protein
VAREHECATTTDSITDAGHDGRLAGESCSANAARVHDPNPIIGGSRPFKLGYALQALA